MMTGDFKLTYEYLKEIGACSMGLTAFATRFPNGAEYQETLDECVKEHREDFATWLLARLGKTTETRVFDEMIEDSERSVIFAGDIVFSKNVSLRVVLAGGGIKAGDGIKAGCGIEAGDGIKAGWGIKAGDGIEAGWGIEAGDCIEAGDGIEVYAGLRCKISKWSTNAIVTARKKPDNLYGGCWVEKQ